MLCVNGRTNAYAAQARIAFASSAPYASERSRIAVETPCAVRTASSESCSAEIATWVERSGKLERLVEMLDMKEEQSVRFFARLNEHENAMHSLGQERMELLDRIERLVRNEADAKEFEALFPQVAAVDDRMGGERKRFFDKGIGRAPRFGPTRIDWDVEVNPPLFSLPDRVAV